MAKTKKPTKTASISSDDSSDAEENIRTQHSDDDDTDIEEDDLFHEEDDDMASSTQIAPQATTGESVKLQLAKALQALPCSQSRNTAAFKRVPWKKLQIAGCSTEELQKHFKEIIKMTSNVRTLGELLADFEQNECKYTARIHPDFPSRPSSAHIKYVGEFREEFQQALEKKHPGKKIAYLDIMKYGAEKFHDLSAKKQERYRKAYKEEVEQYKKNIAAFYKKHPELKPKPPKNPPRGQIKEVTVYTPLLYYREQISKNGAPVALALAQKQWKELSPHEQGRYITELCNLKTDKEKKFSKEHNKLMDSFNGIPPRPYSNAYNVFVKKFHRNYRGEGKELLAASAEAWKKITPEEKARCQKIADEEMDDWIEKIQVHIKTLEPAQRAMLEAKYDLQKLIRKRKAKQSPNDSVSAKKIKVEPLKSAITFAPLEATGKSQGFSDDSSGSPKKKKKKDKNGESSPAKAASPDKSLSPKKKKAPMPEYPSQTTAHYFMTKVYNGNPAKIAKAYKKLDQKEKRIYRDKCIKGRNDYLHEVAKYMGAMSAAEKAEVQKQIEEARALQKDQLEWHTDSGTDKQEYIDTDSDETDDS